MFVWVFMVFPSYNLDRTGNINALLILLFCIFYCLFAPSDILYGINAIIKIFSCFLGYIVGRKVISAMDTNAEPVINYIIIFAFGLASFGTLSLYSNIKNFGIFGWERIMPNFWTGELYNATAQSSLFLLLSGISFYVLVILKRRILLKLLVFTGICLLILNAFLTMSRTAIVYPIITFIITYLSYLFLTRKFRLINFVLLNLLIIVLVVVYNHNAWGIKDFVIELPLFRRMHRTEYINLLEDTRFIAYSFFIKNMMNYPLGGLNSINPIFFMHNLWLDVYATSGIFAFLFLLLFTIRIFINLFKIIKHSGVDDGLKIILIGIYLSFFLLFMSEPVLFANPWFFIIFCIIAGMTDKYIDNINRSVINI